MQKPVLRRIVLSGREYITEMEDILAARHPNYRPEHIRRIMANILNGLVDAIRDWQHHGMNVYSYVENFHTNMEVTPLFTILTKQRFNVLLLQFGYDLARQAKEAGLYDKNGKLQFTYYYIEDSGFKDVALNSILQLQWNGRFHEPIL